MRLAGKRVTLAQFTRATHMQDIGDRLARLGKLDEQILLDNHSRVLADRSTYWRCVRLRLAAHSHSAACMHS